MKEESSGKAGQIVMTISGKGGVRKTATLAPLVEYLRQSCTDYRIYEIDDQPRLRSLFPNRVKTIELPDLEEIRQDDLADAEAFTPLLDDIMDRRASLIAIDIAASVDGRVLETLLKLDFEGAAADAGFKVLVLTPFTLERDALTLAARSIARVKLVLPNAVIVPVHAETGETIATLPSDRRKMVDAVTDGRTFIRHPRLLPRSLAAAEGTGEMAYRIALMPPQEGMQLLVKVGLPRALARGVYSELVIWQDAMREEFDRLPFRNQAGDAP